MLSPSRLVCSLFLFSLVFGAFNTTAHAMLPRESSSKVEDHERLERKPSKISWHDPAAETPTAEETEKLEDRFDLVKTKTRIIEQELLDLDSNENPSLEDPHGLIKAILKDNKEEQKILSSDFV